MTVTDMLELAPRTDLVQLDDAGLADRLDRALEGLEAARKRYGWLFPLYLLSWEPRRIVRDPRDYWYPSHIRSEIVDILAEVERRKQTRI
jgi:hypothetical protein